MRIGFDFDNTIVSYDALFYKVAHEQGVLQGNENIPVNKLAIRDYLRSANKEDIWTEMQGYVYGARMHEAEAYPQVLEVMRRIKEAGHTLAIVSHKTKYPYLGRQYDLHVSARLWIESKLSENGVALISADNIFFELTKEEKLARIATFGCDVFIDDLPEILLAANFPAQTQKFLFDPDEHYQQQQNQHQLANIKIVSSWALFASHLL